MGVAVGVAVDVAVWVGVSIAVCFAGDILMTPTHCSGRRGQGRGRTEGEEGTWEKGGGPHAAIRKESPREVYMSMVEIERETWEKAQECKPRKFKKDT